LRTLWLLTTPFVLSPWCLPPIFDSLLSWPSSCLCCIASGPRTSLHPEIIAFTAAIVICQVHDRSLARFDAAAVSAHLSGIADTKAEEAHAAEVKPVYRVSLIAYSHSSPTSVGLEIETDFARSVQNDADIPATE
jgi:hypothetical protein